MVFEEGPVESVGGGFVDSAGHVEAPDLSADNRSEPDRFEGGGHDADARAGVVDEFGLDQP